jgi:hypothetical protein
LRDGEGELPDELQVLLDTVMDRAVEAMKAALADGQ